MDHSVHSESKNNKNTSLKKVAFNATLHCLTGCAIGEILGMVIGAHFNIHNLAAIILSIGLAFLFGYSFTLFPLIKHLSINKALSLAFASDTLSISVMEIMDNLIIFFIPGALDAGINTTLFWASLVFSLLIAFISAFPLNYYLILKGKGHAVIHDYHK
jgi:hypothetical protein